MTRARRFALLGALYFAQGLPFGFFVQALPVILRERGASLSVIGLSSLLAIPWALKPLVAPWIDRAGSRRACIVPLQASSALLLAPDVGTIMLPAEPHLASVSSSELKARAWRGEPLEPWCAPSIALHLRARTAERAARGTAR